MARFLKGQSGNPAGRPKRTTTERLREQIAEAAPEILKTLIAAAQDGDTTAARLLIDRVVPSLKAVDSPALIPLGPVTLPAPLEPCWRPWPLVVPPQNRPLRSRPCSTPWPACARSPTLSSASLPWRPTPMKPLRTRIEALEARAVKALNTALILFREPLPGEIEAHCERSKGPIFILNFTGRAATEEATGDRQGSTP